ncbi:MAG: hypothetical protein LBL34_03845 [Clostridiales bacterium]|nr:hypothetical protein [Clostridiales bacterium]
MGKTMVIDGNSIMNRAYYAIPILTGSSGTPINAVMGFLNIMLKNLEEYEPDCVAVAFDVHAPTFRHKKYAEYKGERRPTPTDLIAQFPVIKHILGVMGIQTLEAEGYEADDIIGTIAGISAENGDECLCLTGDRDCLQLIDKLTKVVLIITKPGSNSETLIGEKELMEQYGVTPQEYIEVKALMGDKSDNIPGAQGIGEKTAFDLIKQYHSIEGIYANLGALKPKQRENMEEFRDKWEENKFLVTINKKTPINFEHRPFKYEQLREMAILEELNRTGLVSLRKRLSRAVEDQISWF